MPLAQRHLARLRRLRSNSSPTRVQRIVQRIVDDGDPTIGTKMVRYSLVKRWFLEHLPAFADFAKPPAQLVDDVLVKQRNALRQRVNLVVEPEWIRALLSWRQWPPAGAAAYTDELAAYLQFVSGRRISEIYDAQFEQCGSKIGSRDLRKKRGDRTLCVFELYSEEPRTWLALLRWARAHFPDKRNTLTVAVNRRLKELDPRLSSHKLRGIYANLMWQSSDQRQLRTGYIQNALCLESIDVAINYSAYILPATF